MDVHGEISRNVVEILLHSEVQTAARPVRPGDESAGASAGWLSFCRIARCIYRRRRKRPAA